MMFEEGLIKGILISRNENRFFGNIGKQGQAGIAYAKAMNFKRLPEKIGDVTFLDVIFRVSLLKANVHGVTSDGTVAIDNP